MESATKAPLSVRPADKVLQALATLAALIDSTIREVKSLDNEFQTRLLQAVHETEVTLQTQTAEQVERALSGIKSEFDTERERFNAALAKANELGSKLESERSNLAAQLEHVKNDSAAELKNAVHKTEVLLQAQTAESVERTRQEVQEDLKSKFQAELQAALTELRSEFERERSEARENAVEHVQQTRQEVQAQLNEKFQKDLQGTVDGLKAEFEKEREKARENLVKAVNDIEAQLKEQTAEQIEHARLEVQNQLTAKHQKDLEAALEGERGRMNEVTTNLEVERAGLIAQIEQVKSDSAREIEKARAEATAAAAKQAAQAAPAAPPASLQEEIDRSETKLQEILKIIDNPSTELSTVIRKNVEKSELEAYLRGIRLVLYARG